MQILNARHPFFLQPACFDQNPKFGKVGDNACIVPVFGDYQRPWEEELLLVKKWVGKKGGC